MSEREGKVVTVDALVMRRLMEVASAVTDMPRRQIPETVHDALQRLALAMVESKGSRV